MNIQELCVCVLLLLQILHSSLGKMTWLEGMGEWLIL